MKQKSIDTTSSCKIFKSRKEYQSNTAHGGVHMIQKKIICQSDWRRKVFFNSSVEITICMLLTFTATTPTSSAILITIFYLHYLLYNGAIFQSFPRPTFSIIDYLNRRQKAWLKLSIPRRFDFPKFYSLMNFQEEIPLRIKLFTQKSRAENKSSRKAPTVLQRSM